MGLRQGTDQSQHPAWCRTGNRPQKRIRVARHECESSDIYSSLRRLLPPLAPNLPLKLQSGSCITNWGYYVMLRYEQRCTSGKRARVSPIVVPSCCDDQASLAEMLPVAFKSESVKTIRLPTRKLLILLSVFLLAGCAEQISQTLQSWMGHNFNELIAVWGPPSYVFPDGRGGAIFVYAQNRSWVQPGSATTTYQTTVIGDYLYTYGTTTYTPAVVQGYTAYRMFWISRDGVIYSWAWRGL